MPPRRAMPTRPSFAQQHASRPHFATNSSDQPSSKSVQVDTVSQRLRPTTASTERISETPQAPNLGLAMPWGSSAEDRSGSRKEQPQVRSGVGQQLPKSASWRSELGESGCHRHRSTPQSGMTRSRVGREKPAKLRRAVVSLSSARPMPSMAGQRLGAKITRKWTERARILAKLVSSHSFGRKCVPSARCAEAHLATALLGLLGLDNPEFLELRKVTDITKMSKLLQGSSKPRFCEADSGECSGHAR